MDCEHRPARTAGLRLIAALAFWAALLGGEPAWGLEAGFNDDFTVHPPLLVAADSAVAVSSRELDRDIVRLGRANDRLALRAARAAEGAERVIAVRTSLDHRLEQLALAEEDLSEAQRRYEELESDPGATEQERDKARQYRDRAQRRVDANRTDAEMIAAALSARREALGRARAQAAEARDVKAEAAASVRRARAERQRALRDRAGLSAAHMARVQRMLALAGSTGATVGRFIVNWGAVEERRGELRFERLDRIYAAMIANGVQPLVTVLGSPCWAHPATPCGASYMSHRGTREPYRAIAPQVGFDAAWGRFVAETVRRYPAAVGLEVWNEPNLKPYWGPRPRPVRYVELLSRAARASRSVSPDLPVIFGGPSPYRYADSIGIPWRRFVKKSYAAGAAPFTDVLGIHPYSQKDGETAKAQIRFAAAVRNRYDPTAELWATEVGVKLGPGRRAQRRQAKDMAAVHRQLGNRGFSVALFHRLGNFLTEPPNEWDRSMSLTFMNGRPRPALCELAALSGGRPSGCGRYISRR